MSELSSAEPESAGPERARGDLSNPKRVPSIEPGARRIGIVSDTHGWLDPALLEHFAGCEQILHVGDVGELSILERLGDVAPVTAVRGNIDYGKLRDLPLEAIVDFGGLKIAMLHIAGSPRRPHRDALILIRSERPAVFLAGHSHVPEVAKLEGALWINPGAAGHHGFHDIRTAVVFELPKPDLRGGDEAGTPPVSPRLYRIELGPRGRRVRV